jgi:hypothetical protein
MLGKHRVSLCVAGAVGLDLVTPELGICPSWPMVLGAAVPEATVEKHGHFGTGKDQVSGASDSWHWADARAVAQAEGVDG